MLMILTFILTEVQIINIFMDKKVYLVLDRQSQMVEKLFHF